MGHRDHPLKGDLGKEIRLEPQLLWETFSSEVPVGSASQYVLDWSLVPQQS